MTVKVKVTKYTKVQNGDKLQGFHGGVYDVEKSVADALVGTGNASIVDSPASKDVVNVTQEPPFLPSKTSKGDAPKATPKPVTVANKPVENTEDK